MSFDITAFSLTMKSMISSSCIDRETQVEVEAMLMECVSEFRVLDQWKLKHQRASRWASGEPCIYRCSPGVVLGITSVRVTIRAWPRPARAPTEPLNGKCMSVGVGHLEKIESQSKWQAWCDGMMRSGHDPSWWATCNFHHAAEFGAAS